MPITDQKMCSFMPITDQKMCSFIPIKDNSSSVSEYINKFNIKVSGINYIEGTLDPFLENLYNMSEEDYNNWYEKTKHMTFRFFNEEAKMINEISNDHSNLELLDEINLLFKIYKASIKNSLSDFSGKIERISPGKEGKIDIVNELIDGKSIEFRKDICKTYREGQLYQVKIKLIEEKQESIENNKYSKELLETYKNILPQIRKILSFEYAINNQIIIDCLNEKIENIQPLVLNELEDIKTKIKKYKEKNPNSYIRNRDIMHTVEIIKKNKRFK